MGSTMCTKSDVIPMAFMESLGDYVYCYKDADGRERYVGKGRGNRCLTHLNTKNYNIDDLWIVARNLERFNLDRKDASFVLESYLISTHQPEDNMVSGHHKDCFKMAKFSELFNVYKASQRDNFEALPDWYVTNYSKLSGRINVLTIKSDVTIIEFSRREQLQPIIFVNPSDSTVRQFKFVIWTDKAKQIEKYNQLLTFLNSCDIINNNIAEIGTRGDNTTYEINQDLSLDAAIEIVDQFFS